MGQKAVPGRQTVAVAAGFPDIRVYRSLEQIEEIAETWDDLVFGVTGRLPMTSHAWVSTYLARRRQTEQKWVCLAAFQGAELVGVLPVGLGSVRVAGKMLPMLEQAGDAHTQSVDAVTRPGMEKAVLGAFRKGLEEIAPGWFGLDFDRVEEVSPFVTADAEGMTVCREEVSGASVVSCRGDWDEYLGSLSRNFRKRLRRENRRLAELGKVEAEFWSEEEADPEMLGRFARIEASGWKGKAGSAIASQDSLMAFYRALCGRLYERRVLQWHFLRVGGQDLAGHLAVRTGGGIVLSKIGYDEAYAQYSPGVLLLERMLERAFRDGGTVAANLVTDRNWHDTWRPDKRPYYRVRAYPNRMRSVLWGAWPQAARLQLRKSAVIRGAMKAVRSWRVGEGGRKTGGGSGEEEQGMQGET